jgi:hypothetical protein
MISKKDTPPPLVCIKINGFACVGDIYLFVGGRKAIKNPTF